MAALVGACVGFLPYNLNPAKMFMGDTGATFLGFILATMSIQGLFKFYAVISFAVPFLILGLPIFDTAFAFIRRIAHGQSPMHADRSHIHHRLIDMGLNQKQAVATLYVISAILGLSAVVLTTGGEVKAMLLLVALCVVAAVAARVVFPKEVKEELHEELEELTGVAGHQRRNKGRAEGGRAANEQAADHERFRHPAGGHQNGPAGEGTGVPAGDREPLLRHRPAPADAGQRAGGFSAEAGLGPGHHDAPADPVHHHQQVPCWAWTRPSTALKPDLILVHGDTSTTFAGALSAFYHQVPVGHVEAGLRTYDKYSPFPEEMNRKLVGAIADLLLLPHGEQQE